MRTSPSLKAITVFNLRRSSSSSFLHTCRLGRERLLFSNNFEALFARRTTPFRFPQARFRSCTSADIMKVGGYKLSALEIESVLLERDQEKSKPVLSLQELCTWAKDKLAPYKLPTRLFLWDSLPRNAMGKVNKKELKNQLAAQQ
ncbi:hypothetical protein CUMW_275820 [Citrus unshiu]|uniref:AMP-binding enzyme C-terminal domain-containing protein n=1 Tax=Citrus unshiu TaxID=55188 RepID=A0A2H5N0M4_CITUN|nr:hypothetical protein CUMW_275820 [Citrus unshiu]